MVMSNQYVKLALTVLSCSNKKAQLNVLINDIGCAQLCDFGLSRILDDLPSGHTTSLQMGTLRYQAPELLEGDDTREKWRPTTEGDIFAFACTSVRVSRMSDAS